MLICYQKVVLIVKVMAFHRLPEEFNQTLCDNKFNWQHIFLS